MQIWEKYLLPLPKRVAAAPLSSLSLSSKDMHLCYMRLGPSNLLLERSLVFWKMMITCVLWLACSSSLLDLFPNGSKDWVWFSGVLGVLEMLWLIWKMFWSYRNNSDIVDDFGYCVILGYGCVCLSSLLVRLASLFIEFGSDSGGDTRITCMCWVSCWAVALFLSWWLILTVFGRYFISLVLSWL